MGTDGIRDSDWFVVDGVGVLLHVVGSYAVDGWDVEAVITWGKEGHDLARSLNVMSTRTKQVVAAEEDGMLLILEVCRSITRSYQRLTVATFRCKNNRFLLGIAPKGALQTSSVQAQLLRLPPLGHDEVRARL